MNHTDIHGFNIHLADGFNDGSWAMFIGTSGVGLIPSDNGFHAKRPFGVAAVEFTNWRVIRDR